MRQKTEICLLAMLITVLSTASADTQLSTPADVKPVDPSLDCVINPSIIADLGSGSAGVISAMRVDRSDFVNAGDIVAELESGVEVAARDLAQLRAEKDTEVKLRRVNAAFGRRQHARSLDLFQRKVISTNDIDERKTEVQLAQLELRQAQDNRELAQLELQRAEQILNRRKIKSPVNGVVMERFKTIGEYVDEQPVLRVAQLDPLHVEVFVPVERLGEIRPGMSADVWSDAVDGAGWQAEVSRVDPVADIASGTYGVRLVMPNPDYRVPAGLRCRLTFRQGDDETVARLPPRPGIPAIAPDTPDRPDTVEPESAVEAPPPVVETAMADDVRQMDDSGHVCQRVGQFDSRSTADADAARLRADGLDVAVEEVPFDQVIGHQVVSPALPTRAQALALIEQLKAAGVTDYYLSPARDGVRQVSLGLYKSRKSAEKRRDQLGRLGIDASLVPWTRAETQFVLFVTGPLTVAASEQLQRLGGAVADVAAAPDHCPQLASR